MIILGRHERLYSVQPYPDPYDLNPLRKDKVQVKDTGTTRMILGHRCRDFRLVVKTSKHFTWIGDVWSATGIPYPHALGMHDTAGFRGEVPGTPFELHLKFLGHNGWVYSDMVISSINSTSLPSMVFSIPRGYRNAPPESLPGMDMPGRD